MRKIIIPLVCLIFLFLVFDFAIISNPLIVDKSAFITSKRDGVARLLLKDNKWAFLIHDSSAQNADPNKNTFAFRGSTYNIEYKTISSIIISSDRKDRIIKSSINILPHEPDSTQLFWETSIGTDANPFNRFKAYTESKKIANEMSEMLLKLKNGLSTVQSVYGIDIKKEEVNDSILVSTKKNVAGFPAVTTIYKMIDELKVFVKQGGVNITGNPMLNITTADSTNYLVRVALPVDKEVKSTKEYSYKRMMGKGKILRSTVTGGYGAINIALSQMYNFITDNHYVNPAIPFQSLKSDRLIQADSTKWVTDIYYPVM